MTDYTATTRGVEVSVEAFYLDEQSEPERGSWVWAYRVRIANRGTQTVQLLRRTWRITDALGRINLVEGPGVIGEQPILKPDQAFEYTSGIPLPTDSGFMAGTYHMTVTGTGEMFDAEVPMFSLDSPILLRTDRSVH